MESNSDEQKERFYHLSVKSFIGGFFSGLGQLISEALDTPNMRKILLETTLNMSVSLGQRSIYGIFRKHWST